MLLKLLEMIEVLQMTFWSDSFNSSDMYIQLAFCEIFLNYKLHLDRARHWQFRDNAEPQKSFKLFLMKVPDGGKKNYQDNFSNFSFFVICKNRQNYFFLPFFLIFQPLCFCNTYFGHESKVHHYSTHGGSLPLWQKSFFILWKGLF